MVKSNKNKREVYLDHAGATPIDGRVLMLITKTARENFANPSAIHNHGVFSREIVERSRDEVASILNTHSSEIIFVSGATEANNLALAGIVANANFFPHVIITNIEHPSVLEVCKYLEKNKQAEISIVPVEPNGIIDPLKIKKALKSNTILVSVMYANNEIGTIQPIKEIAKVIRAHNKQKVRKTFFHTDATQGVNYLTVDVLKLGVDMMSLNGGKIYGPKGVGVLYVKREVSINPIIFGGDQEFKLRAGTENLPGIAGLAKALSITTEIKDKEFSRLLKLRDYFFKRLTDKNFSNFEVIINGDQTERLPNNVNITIPKIPSELLVIELSAHDIHVSEKSACKSEDKKPSHVIVALRKEKNEDMLQSLRFSLGRSTSKEDIDYVIKILQNILKKLEKWYS